MLVGKFFTVPSRPVHRVLSERYQSSSNRARGAKKNVEWYFEYCANSLAFYCKLVEGTDNYNVMRKCLW